MFERRQFLTGLTAVAGSYLLPAFGDSSGLDGNLSASATAQARSGTVMPPASSIVDTVGNTWTLRNGAVYREGRATSAKEAKLVLFYKSIIYYQDRSNAWYRYAKGRWTQSTDPRIGTFSSTTAAATEMAAIGLHCEGNDTSQYDAFSQWLGKPVKYRVVFTGRDSWDDVASPYYLAATRIWIKASPSHVEVMSVPLLLPGDGSFSTISSGDRDRAFASLAQNIKALGKPSQVVIRLGWEHNGNWVPWHSLKDPAGYVAAFRRVVSVMRAVSSEIRFDWTTDFQSKSSFDWRRAYPGDDVVDIISMDVYDEYHRGWDDLLDAPAGLRALRAFARAHGKPEAYPEWGCSTGSHGYGDNPDFIVRMHEWITTGAPHVLYHAYWNTYLGGPDAKIHGNRAGRVPLAANMYRHLFGA
jgi:hypothetical protein